MLYVVLVINLKVTPRTSRSLNPSFCTGTLIAKDLVITAASCLHRRDSELQGVGPDPSDISVYHYTGTNNNAKKIFLHPEYFLSNRFDLALISLMKEFEVATFPNLPTLPIPYNASQDYCLIAGYGNSSGVALEHFEVMEIMPNKSLASPLKCRYPQKLCLHFEELMPCPGDEGSPLICNGELRAIYTPINPIKFCQDAYAVALTKIYPAKDWVSGIINAPRLDSLEWMNNPLYILLMCFLIMAVTTSIYCLLVICLQRTLKEEEMPMDLRESQHQFPRASQQASQQAIQQASQQLSRMPSPETQATDVKEPKRLWYSLS